MNDIIYIYIYIYEYACNKLANILKHECFTSCLKNIALAFDP